MIFEIEDARRGVSKLTVIHETSRSRRDARRGRRRVAARATGLQARSRSDR
jgi:hypothetical protein